jgi:C_GCAxxG_C_C family probable redox protein
LYNSRYHTIKANTNQKGEVLMTKAKVREKYQGLSRQELLDKAYELGFNYCQKSHSCSQSTVAALHELLGFDDVVVKVATSLCGGSASQYLGTCGALSGGVIVLDYYFGRPAGKMSYEEAIQANLDLLGPAFEAPKALADRFAREYGSIICPHVQRQLFGRPYYNVDPDEARKNEEAQASSDPKNCFGVVGDAARWVMEILLDRDAAKL